MLNCDVVPSIIETVLVVYMVIGSVLDSVFCSVCSVPFDESDIVWVLNILVSE